MIGSFIGKITRLAERCQVAHLKSTFAECGDRVAVGASVRVWSPSLLRVGNDVCIHDFTHIMAAGGITIGDWVQIASHASITTITHDPTKKNRDRTFGVTRPIVIENGVWIGTGAIILPGVTLGEHSVVAAGAVVTKNVSPRTVVAGVPARVIRKLDQADADACQSQAF